jgi:hypothetical protein
VLKDICETINVYQLDPALFHKALDAISGRHMIDNVTLEDKMISCMGVVKTWNLAQDQRSIAALEIHCRLEALANYLAAGGAHGFRHNGLRGSEMLDPGIVTCAAIEPVIVISAQVTFEASSFDRRLLAIVETAGSV